MKNLLTIATLIIATTSFIACGNVEKPTVFDNGTVVLTPQQIDCLDKAWMMEARGLEEVNIRSSNFGAICGNHQQADAYVRGVYKVMGE